MVALCLFKELAFQPLTHSSVNKGRNPSKIKKEEMRFANNYNENQKTNQTAKYWERVTAFGPRMHWVARTQPARGTLEEFGEGESASHLRFMFLTERTLACHTNYHCLCFLLVWFTSYVTGDELFVVGRE